MTPFSSPIREILATAVQHHQAGRLQAAEQVYRQILEFEPDNAEALHLLGVLAGQSGRHESAIEQIQSAIRLNPADAVFHTSLGNVLYGQGQIAEAIACYKRALQLNPGLAGAHNNLGNVLKDQGQSAEAIACYRRAVQLKPDYADAHNNLGNALQAERMFDEASTCYQQALRLRPDFAEAHNNLGNALKGQGRLAEAIACYERALQLKPDFAVAHNNLGTVLGTQGQSAEAIACYRRAIQLKPDYADAHYNLGSVLQGQGRLGEAIDCFQRALHLKPDHAAAYNNLGNTLKDRGQHADAAACYRQALQWKPDFAEAYINLGTVLSDQGQLAEAIACYQQALQLQPDHAAAHNNLGNAFKDRGQMAEAISCFRQALQREPDLAAAHNNLGTALSEQGQLAEAIACFERALKHQPDLASAHSNLVYTLVFCPEYDGQSIAEACRGWNRQHAEPLAKFILPHVNERSPDRRLRVGYVSPDFRDHAASNFTVPLLSAHDHRDFEIFCYADVAVPDRITERLRSCADAWRNTAGLTDEQIAELVRRDRIDILVDLTMHMARNRLLVFARKPAPVQVCWLAYQGTTGLSTIDYRLTDPYLDPPGLFDDHYSEVSFRLPDTFWCYEPLIGEPDVNPLPASESGCVTFGSLNNFCKVNDPVLELWARVVQAVPHSRLLLLAAEGVPRQHTLQVLERAGVASDRVTFVGKQPRRKYLETYQQIDIGLDTFPYNGQTTTLDSFRMGVPVITITGPSSARRAGLSLLTNVGLPELVAETPDQFVKIAVDLAGDLPRLSQLRATLRDRLKASPLMDAPRFARNIAAAYRSMWRRWCAGPLIEPTP